MRRRPVLLLTPAPLAGLVLAALTLAGCTRQPTPGLPPGTSVEDLPASESWGAELRTSEDGERRLEIDAPYLARYVGDSTYVYLGPDERGGRVVVRVFNETGHASVAASEAWYYEEAGRLVAQGAVETAVEGEDAAEVRADRVTLVDQTVEAEGGVRASVQASGAQIEAPRLRLAEGGAFEASGGTVVHLTGDVQAVVRARRVSGTGGGGRVEASGDARVEASGGRVLEAERVVWDEAAGRFRAPGAFSFTGPGERVRGVGLDANRDLTRYTFRNITGEIEVQE